MDYKYEVVDKVPDQAMQAHRNSRANRIVDDLRHSPTGVIKVMHDDKTELDRIYKTLIQWRSRHPGESLGIRKSGDLIYLWLKDRKSERE